MILSIFSCACWPFVYLLWMNDYSNPLPIFYWVIWSTEVFNFDEAQFIFSSVFFCFFFLLFVSYLRNHCILQSFVYLICIHNPWRCIPIFSSKSSVVLDLFEFIFLCGKNPTSFFLVCGYLVSQHICINFTS